ncbi:MAG TPA: delta-60 repeat domain-containing protein [Blastocatellia bacterium]
MMRRTTKHRVYQSRIAYLAIFLVVLLLSGPRVSTAKGTLLAPDPTFGQDGKVQTKLETGCFPYGLAVKSDGDLIAVGYAFPDKNDFNTRVAGIVEYKSGGNRNSQFGQSGIVFNDNMIYANAVVEQPDGELIVEGQTVEDPSPGTPTFVLARYNPDGSLDSSFGNGGQVFDSYSKQFDGVTTLAVQSDGKILAAGVAGTSPAGASESTGDFAIARYNPDGTLDTTFGASGKVLTDFDGGYDVIGAIFVQPNGKILTAGWVGTPPENFGIGLAQYNPDGSLDSTFGNGGKSSASLPGASEQMSTGCMAVDSSGNIVVGGIQYFDGGDNAKPDLVRFNSAGALDASFGNGGRVDLSDVAGGLISGVQIQPDGKIFVSGFGVFPYAPVPTGVFSARYNSDGTADAAYNGGAPALNKFYGGFGQPYVGILQPNGDFLVAGYDRDVNVSKKLLLLRYQTGAE